MRVIDPGKYDVDAIRQAVKVLRKSLSSREIELVFKFGSNFRHGAEQLISLAEDVLGDIWGRDQE